MAADRARPAQAASADLWAASGSDTARNRNGDVGKRDRLGRTLRHLAEDLFSSVLWLLVLLWCLVLGIWCFSPHRVHRISISSRSPMAPRSNATRPGSAPFFSNVSTVSALI